VSLRRIGLVLQLDDLFRRTRSEVGSLGSKSRRWVRSEVCIDLVWHLLHYIEE
jgi:hypothetical protein